MVGRGRPGSWPGRAPKSRRLNDILADTGLVGQRGAATVIAHDSESDGPIPKVCLSSLAAVLRYYVSHNSQTKIVLSLTQSLSEGQGVLIDISGGRAMLPCHCPSIALIAWRRMQTVPRGGRASKGRRLLSSKAAAQARRLAQPEGSDDAGGAARPASARGQTRKAKAPRRASAL